MHSCKLKLCVLLWFFIHAALGYAQSDTPLAKIFVDEQGNVSVFDIQEDITASENKSREYASPRLVELGSNTQQRGDVTQSVGPRKMSRILDLNVSTIQYSAESGSPLKPENPGPNLVPVMSSSSFSYDEPLLTVNVRVRNNGTASAGFFNIGYYLSTDTDFTTSDYLIGDDFVPSLLWYIMGMDYSITVDLTTVPGLPMGWYFVGFFIDFYNAVAEDNETDNTGYFVPTIWTEGYRLPNLWIENISIYDFGGPDIDFSVWVNNSTYGTAGPHHIACYLDHDLDDVTALDYLICTEFINRTLYAGESYFFDKYVTVSGVPEGWYNLAIFVDSQEEVDEQYENDNIKYNLSRQIWIPSTPVQENEWENFLPEKTVLQQNFPNPFNPKTQIPYSVGKRGRVTIRIYNLKGESMDTLVDEEQQPGTYLVEWNAENFSSGIYLYRLEAGDYVETRKLILQK